MRKLRTTPLISCFCLIFSAQLFAANLQTQTKSSDSQKLPKPVSQRPTLGPAALVTKAIEYQNRNYGFVFSLPATWKGYKAVESTWIGYDDNGPHGMEEVTRGPWITLVNPQSSPDKHYQDIYIMVFSYEQWHDVQQGDFSVSAAPVGPGEYGRNKNYVFAEPPRMIGYDDSLGTDEVAELMKGKPLRAFNISKNPTLIQRNARFNSSTLNE